MAFNALSLPQIDQAVQTNKLNSLKLQDAEQTLSANADAQTRANQDRMADDMGGMATMMLEELSRDRNAYAKYLPKVQQTVSQWGIPAESLPPAGSAPDEVIAGFQDMLKHSELLRGRPQYEDITRDGVVTNQRDRTTGELSTVGATPKGPTSNAQDFAELQRIKARYGANSDEAKMFEAQLVRPSYADIGGVRNRITPTGTAPLGTLENEVDAAATLAESKKFAELTGASRAQSIDAGVESIDKIDANISNLNRAISELDAGAQSGPLINKYSPTIRAATIALEQTRSQLGLDVVGAVTFGALSEGEMRLAMAVALPDLPPAELKEWITARIAAQTKLRTYYKEQIDFLDDGGTVAQFLRKKERGGGGSALKPTGKTATNPQTGERLQEMSDGTWQPQ